MRMGHLCQCIFSVRVGVRWSDCREKIGMQHRHAHTSKKTNLLFLRGTHHRFDFFDNMALPVPIYPTPNYAINGCGKCSPAGSCANCLPAATYGCVTIPTVKRRCAELCQAHIPAASITFNGAEQTVAPVTVDGVVSRVAFNSSDLSNSHLVFGANPADQTALQILKPGQYKVDFSIVGTIETSVVPPAITDVGTFSVALSVYPLNAPVGSGPIRSDRFAVTEVRNVNVGIDPIVLINYPATTLSGSILLRLEETQVPVQLVLENYSSTTSLLAVETPASITLTGPGGAITANIVVTRIDSLSYYRLSSDE